MFAYSTPPQLELIQGYRLQARIEDGLQFGFVVGEFAQENQAKLRQLEQERDRLSLACAAAGLGGIAGFILLSPLFTAMAALPALSSLLGELQTTSQRFFLMTELMEALEDENVAIEIGLKPEGLREIDFFLRFSDKEYVLIQIRSLGDAKVTYNEEREALRFRKKGGGSKTWEPDPLFELAEQERWLRRQRYDLLGQSARDRRRPLAKLLVLWQETVLGDHPEHLYVTMDDQKYLTIRKMGTTALVTKEQVIDFIRGYLASRRSRKTS
ncbi:hypothetical protein H6F67_21185 [Microcoleus sp. FACHB-1515]|uniref:hypothetical protein n=1 Tax=Cyanophyceae TaxID=3028117 RepID=UPI0016845539|nr:hypothetical protein [Microcoleus sp. FACHB-1515]MBD2092367.1 hypothetical protein [Microcoleus sp. FACHB-1515]